jgi:hypothetical protein
MIMLVIAHPISRLEGFFLAPSLASHSIQFIIFQLTYSFFRETLTRNRFHITIPKPQRPSTDHPPVQEQVLVSS